jgi:tripartite-type tricarboxylate transporter receptor subunit TctC
VRTLAFVAALVAGFAIAFGAQAQDAAAFYRGKTISLIVGTGAGGGFDAYARLLAPGIERATGARVVVDNRSGAGGLIALNAAMAAPADGLTLMLVNGPAAVAAQLLHQEGARFDLTKFGWIGGLAREPWILVARRGLTVASLPTAGSGDVVRWGASGKTDSQAVSAATLSEALGLRSRIIVGYKGSAEVGTSVLRGETDAMVLTSGSASAALRDPDLVALATLARQRSEDLPDLPTIFEIRPLSPDAAWWIDFNAQLADTGRVLAMAPGAPEDRLNYLREVVRALASDPDILAQSRKLGRAVTYEPPGPVADRIGRLLQDMDSARLDRLRTVILEKFY